MQESSTITTSPVRQFDFWLGDWSLSWGDGQTGINHVAALWDGAVIQENFDGTPSMPLKGMSVSTFDRSRNKWRQTWVDNQGSYIDLIGEFKDGEMVLFSEDMVGDKQVKFRMIFYNIAANSFDWNWEQSQDEGESWQLQWKIYYVRTEMRG